MPRLIVVERDSGRRDSLQFVLNRAGYEVLAVPAEEAPSRWKEADLLIIGDSDLQILNSLPRTDSKPVRPVLALIDPGNCESILACLHARVAGMISRLRTPDEILAEVRRFTNPLKSSATEDSPPSPATAIPRFDPELPRESLVKALQSACNDIVWLQDRYENELSHRHKVEQALMESEVFYQSLVETLPLAMLRKDLNGRFTFANRLLCEAFNRPPEAIIGHVDYDFFPRELADKYRADDRKVLEQRSTLETIEEFQTPNGDRRYTHVVKSPVYDAAGNLAGIQGIFSDVTEKECAERELVQTQARLQAVLDAATQVAIISSDLDGKINLFNTGAERMLGYTKEEMLGKTPEIFHLGSEIEARAAEMSREFGRPIQGMDVFVEHARRGEHDEREWTYVRKDGSHIRVALSVTAKRDSDGNVSGFLGIALDITTRHLAEAELLKAKEAAESANRAKSDFLANMSHEIRTPLNAIIGMTELVRDTELDVTQREYLALVQESGESLLSVINDILDFSKIEAGKLSLECVPFDLRELLGDTAKSLALRAHRKDLELACHVATGVPAIVEGDPHRLRQIVMNLVGNAIKFTEKGEVVLHVDVESSTDHDLYLHFRVTDTGIGISADQLHTIFEAFEQADTSTTRRYGGTGLGLAISSRLVELMQGRVWVDSALNQGSTFHFLARFGVSSDEALASNSTIYPPMLQGLPVLVVDDNATNRRILIEILNNWSMKPTAVSSVAEAVDELKRMADAGNPYGLILTDASMPDVDGFTLARRIQENRVLCRSMVMMLTSADRPGDLRRCEELGVAAYLVKPIKQSELLDAILVAVGGQSPLSGAQETPASSARKSGAPKSILLAEDSLINQKLAIGLLEKWGHRVTVANDGREAVELSQRGAFDLVLMDVQMPELDGLDATREIRRRELLTGEHIPIVAMTAHAMKGDRELCLESGMDDYLMKPIRAEQLFQVLERIGAGQVLVGAAASNTTASDRIDWDLARRAVNHDEDLLRQVVEAFLEEGPHLLQTMRSSSSEGEWKQFQRAAHTLKSGLRMFGINSLADEVERLELAAKTGELTSASGTRMDQITSRSRGMLSELQAFSASTTT
ncbi:response regulator [Schlesneria sp. T3-172]|uniref:response regulator n=1 Tax=Schlesneria sphaerica TaxID=3373610 RepID=UPI0037C77B16